MFKNMSAAKFISNGKEAFLFLDQGFSIIELESIAGMITHYCVERKNEEKANEDTKEETVTSEEAKCDCEEAVSESNEEKTEE